MTKSPLLILMFIITTASGGFAQRCEHNDLSKKYDYVISTVKTKAANGEQPEMSGISVKILDKANKKQLQKIVVKPDLLFQNAFTDCSAARSFVTGKNAQADANDNDYGDFIVADFNFDSREDFAVKRDSGGNGGAFYEYYTQNKLGKFQKDSFLTDQIVYFPGEIDARRKRLITYIHANVAGYNEKIYKYNSTTGKWTALKPIYRKAGQ